jgi:Sugar (and other) transporter
VFRWIDKVGRRPLALWGYAGMAVFILIAAAGMGFLTGVPKTVLVMVGFFFITAFAIGVSGTGWLIQGEVFPTAVSQSRGRCGRHQTRGVVRRRLRHPKRTICAGRTRAAYAAAHRSYSAICNCSS